MISFIEGSRKYKLTYGAVSISSCLVLGKGKITVTYQGEKCYGKDTHSIVCISLIKLGD